MNLMRVNILKRLESSIESFRLTISRIYDQTKKMIDTIEEGQSIDVNNVEEEDDDIDNLMIGNKIQVKVNDLDKIRIM